MSFSPEGSLLASGSLDKTLKLWDLTEAGCGGSSAGRCRQTFQGHKDFVLLVVFALQVFPSPSEQEPRRLSVLNVAWGTRTNTHTVTHTSPIQGERSLEAKALCDALRLRAHAAAEC